MAFLRIDKIKLQNIRCFEDQTFKFSEGVNVITGPNGSGKSTIITAIGFGLYGADYLTGSDLVKADLVKRDEEEGKITLTFTTHEGTFISDYKLRITGSDYWQLFETGNEGAIAETISETRTVIQSKIGDNIDHQTFKTALCSRQGEITSLLDSKASKRNDLIKKILGLENFDKTNRVMAKFSTHLENETKVKESNLAILNENMMDGNAIKKEKAQVEDNLALYDKNLQSAEAQVKRLTQEVKEERATSNRIIVLKESIEDLKKVIDSTNESLQSMKTQKTNIEKDLEISNISTELIQKILQETNNELNTSNLHLSELRNKYEGFIEDKTELESVQKDINQISIELENKEKILQKLTEKEDLKAKNKKIQEYKSSIKSFDNKKDSLTREMKQLKNTITNEEDRISNLESKIQNKKNKFQNEFNSDIEDLDQIIKDTKATTDKLQSRISGIETNVNQFQEKIGQFKAKTESIEQTIEVLNNSSIDSDCPVCQQSLDDVDKTGLISIQNDLKLELEKQLKHTEIEFQKVKDQFTNLSEKLENAKTKQVKLQQYLNTRKEMNNELDDIKQINNNIEQLRKSLQPIENEFEDLMKTDPEKLRKETENLQSEITEIEELSKQLTNFKNQKELKLENTKKLSNKIKDIDQKNLELQIKNIKQKNEKLVEKRDKLSDKVLPLLNHFSDQSNKLSLKKAELQKTEAELEKFEHKFDQNQLIEKEEKLQEATKQTGEFENSIKEAKRELKRLEEELETAQKQREDQTKLNKELDELATLEPISTKIQKILNDAPEFLISKTSAKISNHLTNMLRQLLPNQGFERAKFESDGNVIVYSNSKPVDKNTLSGGEKTVLALALRMALADYVAPLQYLTLDEPTNHLDSQRVEEFIEIIDQEQLFAQSKGQLLLVTHKPEFNRNAQNSIELEISNGVRQKLQASEVNIDD